MKLKVSTGSMLYKSQTLKESTPIKQRGTATEYSSTTKQKTLPVFNKQVPLSKPAQAQSEIDSTNDITIADEQGMNQPRVNPINSRTLVSAKGFTSTKYALSDKKQVVSRNVHPSL